MLLLIIHANTDEEETECKTCAVDHDCLEEDNAYGRLRETLAAAGERPPFPASKYHLLIKEQWMLHPFDQVVGNSEEVYGGSCDTPFDDVIHNDLSVWKANGGISHEAFEEAKSLGVHYQIIDHKLYREKDCMFGARCKGVEHYLLKIIHHLPDVELIINVFDWPKVCT